MTTNGFRDAAFAWPLEITPRGTAYGRELSLLRWDRDKRLAAWLSTEGDRETICWRMITPEGPRPIHAIETVGASAQPLAASCPTPAGRQAELFWTEFGDACASLRRTALHPQGGGGEVSELDPGNCGHFAACAAGESCVIALERWRASRVGLDVIVEGPGGRQCAPLPEADGVFRQRPALAAYDDDVVICWDEYATGRYRIVATDSPLGEGHPMQLPAPDEAWETLPAVAFSRDGTCFVARCRERRVELEHGIAGWHSELAVARFDRERRRWTDVATIDIDHGMNPWMAAYVSRRRFPKLVGRERGVWLLWEEKIEPRKMLPSLGRLCAVPVSADGLDDAPRVVVDGFCAFVVETGEGLDEKEVLVATKTQRERQEQRLPYLLHRVNLTAEHPARPDGLESNRSAPAFVVRVPSRPRPRMAAEGLSLFFGDPHLHSSRFSGDLDGEQDELYHYARDVARVDFAAFTENDFHWLVEPLPEAHWQQNRRNAEFFNDPGRFTALLGWEYTRHKVLFEGDTLDSHRSVLFPGSEGEVYTWYEGETPTPQALADRFRGRRVLLHHHHPMGFDLSDDRIERNIEIYSGWWNCMARPEFVEKLHALLAGGFRLGFIGASDNHERNPGLGGALTGVWATENTREAIFDALWNRRCFATTGCRPELRFRVAGAFMGSEARADGAPPAELHVRADAPVLRLEILRDGRIVYYAEPGEAECDAEWEDADCPAGLHFYYAHIVLEGEEENPYWNIATACGVQAWSSPVWVERA